MHSDMKSAHEQFFNKLLDIRFLVIISMVALFIDMEISNEAHIFYKDIATDIGITIFILIYAIYLISQQCILSYSKKEQVQTGVGKSSFGRIRKITNIMIFFITICFLTIIIEILIQGYYDTFLLMFVLVASNAIAIIAMGYMSSKFFTWYYNRKQSTILIFGAMALITSITAFVTVLFVGAVLINQQEKVTAVTIVLLPVMDQGSFLSLLNYIYFYMIVSTYIITWVITSLLLKDYIKRVGKLKYWILLSLPLVFYLSQLLVTQFGLFIPEDAARNLNFQMWFLFFYTPSSLIGGILFSIPFFLITRELKESKPLQSFLRITAYGLILFFAAGSATIYHTPYPPFGLLTVAAIGPSSFIIAMGIYFSTRIISRNKTIEIQMKKSSEYAQFFADIGSAEMQKVMTEIIEGIRKKLPPDEESSKELETVNRELIEYLKEYRVKKRSSENLDSP